MNIPVVITDKEYKKGEKLFEEQSGTYRWIVSPPEEAAVAEAVRTNGAYIVVLGVDTYTGELYKALSESATAGGSGKSLIVRHGVGCDGVDTDLCKQYNILPANTPGTLDQSVAEYTMALLLSLFRNVPSRDALMRERKFEPKTGFELKGKTIGIAGLGHIGKLVSRCASFGFGMEVAAFDCVSIKHQADRAGVSSEEFMEQFGLGACYIDFNTFAASIDILSIHMPVTEETTGYFNAERLGQLREGAYVINTSRGKLVDETALYDLLASGHLAGAALDVYWNEPYEPVDPGKDLRTLENTVLTPHIASDTRESNDRMEYSVLANMEHFLAGEIEKMNLVE